MRLACLASDESSEPTPARRRLSDLPGISLEESTVAKKKAAAKKKPAKKAAKKKAAKKK